MTPSKKHDHKLILTIVKRGRSKKVMKASKAAGAEGGTVLLANGRGIHEKGKSFGLDQIYEKDLIFTLVRDEILPDVLGNIIDTVKLDKKGQGLGCIIDIKKTMGINHMDYEEREKEDLAEMTDDNKGFNLIVTIVNKGDAGKVVDSSIEGGAEGGTILNGRGSGIHEKAKLLSLSIEPEKDIVLTLIKRDKTKEVLSKIEEGTELNQPGKGICFVLPVEETVGIHHLLQDEE
ncbi:P-II family nitrogen regulator [Alteribacter keqinensis]|uniref:P-II family nitrogen regulator n=1 Tax=Alteribacter keqinensis TaxID=2483800 RepID=A0A3M7TUX1_9BACI|nr:P-II family nitrogen regulator [Alteribacter keqinensis]RNA68524.1 P-II family nitrogen regulator [Alteribacter keqinensis]